MAQGKYIDISGEQFWLLTVIRRDGKDRQGNATWLCKCTCGNTNIVTTGSLRSGNTKTCGKKCGRKLQLSRDIFISKYNCTRVKHPNYQSWKSMINRTTYDTNPSYNRYKGRGVTVCKRWLKFENFLTDMGEKPSPEYELDRINNNGNYCKENCRWATRKEQMNNMSRNVKWNNETLTQAAHRLGISCVAMNGRIKRGWTLEQAFTTPKRLRNQPPFIR